LQPLRLVTSMRVYWDRISVADADALQPRPVVLEPQQADLHWRGFSAEISPDGREPFGYDYSRVTPRSPWKLMPGRYTREGDVRELVMKSDDMFVVAKPGDEIAVSFDASSARPLPAGWSRTFLLKADGFSKEMDLNSASPDHVEPLPFHHMSEYPYTPMERYPDSPAYRQYRAQYNTRRIVSAIPFLRAR